MYLNVDVQLFWKLLLAVSKATDNSVFCKRTLIRPTRKSIATTQIVIGLLNVILNNNIFIVIIYNNNLIIIIIYIII